jgi:hypothetical protein
VLPVSPHTSSRLRLYYPLLTYHLHNSVLRARGSRTPFHPAQ